MGTLWNSVAGIIGGGIGGQLLGMICAGGGVLMAIVSAVRGMMGGR